MTKIGDYLRERYGAWGWLGQRAHDASGINKILPLDLIISCYHGREISHYFREEDLFSVEGYKKTRKNWSNEDLKTSLRGQMGRDIYSRLAGSSKALNLLCYRSVRELESAGKRNVVKPGMYAVPEALKKHFDDKILLQKSLPALGLPKIPGVIGVLSKYTFKDVTGELSLPFVVQFPYGSSGSSTYIVKEERQYNDVREKYPSSKAVMRKYIDGFSLNVNAVILSDGTGTRILCAAPSIQLIGIPECSNTDSAYCGNDYAAAAEIDPSIKGQIRECVHVIGKWMAVSGYRGIFGMDFLFKDGVVYPVEINPRFQNSTSLHTTMDMLSGRGESTLFLLHVSEFIPGEDDVMKKCSREASEEVMMDPIKGSQLILHNNTKKNVVTGDLLPGVYEFKEKELKFIKEAATLDECRDSGDILVTCGVPEQTKVIGPEAPLCKIQRLAKMVVSENNRELTDEMKEIVGQVYEKLALKTAGEMERVSI